MDEGELLHELESRIRSQRKRIGFTQEELPLVAGVDWSYFGAVERGVGDFLILRAVRDGKGAALAVPEEAIADAARDDGFLLCPEGGAVLAGWRLALERGLVGKDERVLLFNCANGNKYPLADTSRRIELAKVEAGSL